MKNKMIALTLVSSMFLASTPRAVYAASGAELVKNEVLTLKEEVLVEGLDEALAFDHFTTRLEEKGLTPSDVVSFVEHSGSADEVKVFETAFAGGIKNRQLMQSALKNALSTGQKSGSNFRVSCGVGLGVSIPVMLAGLTMGVLYLVNLHHDRNIQSEYSDKVSRENGDYYSKKGTYEVEIASQNSAIATDKTQIDYLKQKIASGVYSADDREVFSQQIASYNADIAYNQNILSANTAKLKVVQDNYDQQMIAYTSHRDGQISQWKDAQRLNEIIAIVGVGAGIPLFVNALNDCH